MSGINKVILVGNIGAKPEVKYSSNGSAILICQSQLLRHGMIKIVVKNKKKLNGIE